MKRTQRADLKDLLPQSSLNAEISCWKEPDGKTFQKLWFLCSFLVLFGISGCSKEEPNPPENGSENENLPAETLYDVSYGADPAQVYDLYLPANRSAATTKVLVFIHGGGWIQGDKADMKNYIPLVQKNHPEHAIVNLNYRLAAPPSRPAFPNQFLDLQLALEQLSEEAADLQINPEFGLIGTSAGGHLALQYDSVYDEEDLVKLVCSIVGPTDLTDPHYSEDPSFGMALQLLVDENAYPGISNYARAVSPAHQVDQDNSPTIMFYGEEDPLVPLSNGLLLDQKLDAAGIENEFTSFEGGHGDWENEDNQALQLQLSDFIEEHLGVE